MSSPLEEQLKAFDADTPAELVAAWDAGLLVPTIEMGGLGPGYEQALQIAFLELLRLGKEGFAQAAARDRVLGDAKLALSGAQASAATHLARTVLTLGSMRATRGQLNERGRWIMVSKAWPTFGGSR